MAMTTTSRRSTSALLAGAAFIAILTLASPAGAAPQPHDKATAAARRSAAISARFGQINGESVDRDHSKPIEILSFPALDGSGKE